jgi:hypothetical protein
MKTVYVNYKYFLLDIIKYIHDICLADIFLDIMKTFYEIKKRLKV